MLALTDQIKEELLLQGADIVGFGDLRELPEDMRAGLPVGISVAVVYPGNAIRGIDKLPTQEYRDWYDKLNKRLDRIVTYGAAKLCEMGYAAIAMTREHVGNGGVNGTTVLPHKTVATRAGIGWIGKCALLVTRQYGSALRISSILTDAPLETAEPIDKARCGDCVICKVACPAQAVSGKQWRPGLPRDEFFDSAKCRKTARERAKLGFNGDITICGKCIEVCPHTRRYIVREL